ncbi:MAG: aminotransferase class V-fold PLP-dependent enzyme [Balneolaceae bacterium]
MLQILAGVPLLGAVACAGSRSTSEQNQALNGDDRDLFEELNIKPIINGRGTLTILSGSLMLPEVMHAINQTSTRFANLNEVRDKVGARMAELLNCEAAMVTAGAASALTLGTAATITGTDEDKIKKLPNLEGPRREVIIQKKHRFGYDHAVRNTGVKMVEVEDAAEMEDAINDRTVMGLFFNAAAQFGDFEHPIEHEEFVAICKRHDIPSFIDAAADVPPVENLFKYTEMGFDMVTFSGGKAIRGPQSAGLLFGRKDLIEAAKLNHNPNSDTIGRGMKVNKEEIIGMYAALDAYLKRDHDAQWQEWVERTEHIASVAETVPTVEGETHINPGPANHFPDLRIKWDQDRLPITPGEVVEALKNGDPSIEVSGNSDTLNITVVMLKPEEVDIVAQRVREVLEQVA